MKKPWLITTLLAMLIFGRVPPAAQAHAALLRSDPADNAILAGPPAEARLWFSEAISTQFSSAQILDINGQPVEHVSLKVEPAERLLIVTLPDLPEGLYSIRWKVLSEADGHFTQGLLVFAVGEGLDPAQAMAPASTTKLPLPELWLRWLNFAALLTLVGAMVVSFTVLATPSRDWEKSAVTIVRRAAQQRALALAAGMSGLAWLVGLGLLGWQVTLLLTTLPEGASFWGVAWQLAALGRWGQLWLARQVILLVLAAILFWLYRTRREARSRASGTRLNAPLLLPLFIGLLLAVLLSLQVLTGHAAAISPHTVLAVFVDVLHLLAASGWVGGLLALLVGFWPLFHRERARFPLLMRAIWLPFSRLAVVSVGLLVITGLYNTGQHVASVDALLTTLYGQALLGKIGLMLVVGLCGLLNSMLLHPRLAAPLAWLLRRPPGWTPFSLYQLPWLALAEGSLALLVVLATGVLTASAPARGPEFEVVAEEIPDFLSQTVDDMLITFSAKPNRPGQNLLSIRAVSTRRPPPAEVMRVILRFTFLGQDLGRTSADAVELEPGLYQLGGSQFSLAGAWQIQVVVRRRGIEDTVAQFQWVVAPPGPARPTLISKRPLQPLLSGATVALSLLLAMVSLAWLKQKQWAWLWSLWAKTNLINRKDFQNETVVSILKEIWSDAPPVFGAVARWLWRRHPAPPPKYDL